MLHINLQKKTKCKESTRKYLRMSETSFSEAALLQKIPLYNCSPCLINVIINHSFLIF